VREVGHVLRIEMVNPRCKELGKMILNEGQEEEYTVPRGQGKERRERMKNPLLKRGKV
jgi:hypothetical protein